MEESKEPANSRDGQNHLAIKEERGESDNLLQDSNLLIEPKEVFDAAVSERASSNSDFDCVAEEYSAQQVIVTDLTH